MDDYYHILGVGPFVTSQELKKAFHKLAKQHHPDIATHPLSGEYFKKITLGYETLSDPLKRKQYDAMLLAHKGKTLTLPLKETLHSTLHTLGQQTLDFLERHLPKQEPSQEGMPCVVLTIADLYMGGKRLVHKREGTRVSPIEVDVPLGILPHDKLTLSAIEKATVVLAPHAVFSIHNQILHAYLPVNLTSLLLGDKVALELPDQSQILITVPPCTSPQQVFKIPHKGLYASQTGIREELRVHVNPQFPSQLTEKMHNLLLQLKSEGM